MKLTLNNTDSSLTIDLFGGAITDFHLKNGDGINPLNFAFTEEQMPVNNKAGAPYQGHFLCLGRWGSPSENEIKAGVPNHGEIANILWNTIEKSDNILVMQTTGKLEGLHVKRIIELDKQNPVFGVNEIIKNINPLGRLYNIVQHSTLASPFLDELTIVNCNATTGFGQDMYKHAEENSFQWPHVNDEKGNSFNLGNPHVNYNSVFSFVVDKNSDTGWLTAYSPRYHLLFGYVWKRKDYPWLHLWQHWENNRIKYRGIEFGTAGIHQPFKEIINTATHLFGERTVEYIDAGEIVSKKYFSFIYKTEKNFSGAENVTIVDNTIQIETKEGQPININASFNLLHEL